MDFVVIGSTAFQKEQFANNATIANALAKVNKQIDRLTIYLHLISGSAQQVTRRAIARATSHADALNVECHSSTYSPKGFPATLGTTMPKNTTTGEMRRYVDLSPNEREHYERAFGGRLPIDAEVGQRDGWTQIGVSLNSPTATDEDLLITGTEQ